MAAAQIAVIVGVGPGLGRAVAERFARGGFDIVLMARSTQRLSGIADAVRAAGREAHVIGVDVTAPDSVAAAFAEVRTRLGDPSVLVYNAGRIQIAGLLDIEPEEFDSLWQTNCRGAFLAAREVLPAMRDAERGSIILTGATAAVRGGARFASFAVGKFGLRALAQSMAREFGPAGVHVAHAVIDGQIATPTNVERMPDAAAGSLLDPEAIADSYWHLHQQPRSVWTHELDLRPASETF